MKTVAESRGTRSLAAAVSLCVSWMVSNLDTTIWDEVLKAPRRWRATALPKKSMTSAAPDQHSITGAASGAADRQQETELVIIEEIYSGDRRSSRRYPIQMGVKARRDDHSGASISGATVNVSSSGLLLISETPIERNVRLSVTVEWPVPSHRGKPLRLRSHGETVWCSGNLAGLRIENWEFCEDPGAN